MRALCLLMLVVVMLAMMQASYLVVEAKRAHHDLRLPDDAERHDSRWKAKHHKKEHAHKEDKKEKEKTKEEEPAAPIEVDHNVVVEKAELPKKDNNDDIYNQMMGDQAAAPAAPEEGEAAEAGEKRSGRRERVSQEERRARKKEKKAERRENRRNNDGEQGEGGRGGKKAKKEKRKSMTPEEKQAAKQARKEKKMQRKAEKSEKKSKKQRTPCTTDTDCGEASCCMPSRRSGEKTCKANNKPRTENAKCYSSCSCEGDLKCYTNPEEESTNNNRKRSRPGKAKRKFGVCKAAAVTGDMLVDEVVGGDAN